MISLGGRKEENWWGLGGGIGSVKGIQEGLFVEVIIDSWLNPPRMRGMRGTR